MASSHNSAKRSKLGHMKVLKDGTVRVTVSSGYDLEGRKRSLSGYAHDEAEAEKLAMELAAQLGKRPDLGRRVQLKTWWAAYQAGRGKRIARATLMRYAEAMKHVWLPALGERDISLITKTEVQDVLLSLDTRSKASHAKSALSAVLTQAVRDGYLSENPIRTTSFEMPGDVGTQHDWWEGFDEDDPFGSIEGGSDVWDARTLLRAAPVIDGTAFYGAWLAMVGAGLRLEEALALYWKDVRRIEIEGREVTQIAVHHAETAADGRKRSKTRRSIRIVAMVEPFGSKLWAMRGDRDEKVSNASPNNIYRQWRRMWDALDSPHVPKSGHKTRGRMVGLEPPIPYVPLSRMRHSHETYMQQAGVLDSVNAAAHGHSERVSYKHYQKSDGVEAARKAGEFLLVSGGGADGDAFSSETA